MFGFTRKKAEVVNHWISFVENFNIPSSEFYRQVQETLRASNVPEMRSSLVNFLEGALLSDKRTYLRFVRERLVFDICACPFGKAYFFSCRTAVIPAQIRLWEVIVFGIWGVVGVQLLTPIVRMFLPTANTSIIVLFATFALAALSALLIYALCRIGVHFQTLDAVMTQIPIVRSVYEAIRRDTYYRHDTRLMYIEQVFRVVKTTAEKVTAAHGLKLVRQYAQSPLFGDMYQPVHDDLLVLQRADEAFGQRGFPPPIISM